jgi:hypothetical protein
VPECPVPRRVNVYHPAARAYRAAPDGHEVTSGALARGCRILHALATEAERHGHHASHPASQHYLSDLRAALKAGQLHIRIGEHTYQLRIREDSTPAREALRYGSRGYDRLPGWQRLRRTAFHPTGRLRITLGEGYSRDGRPAEFKVTLGSYSAVSSPASPRMLSTRATIRGACMAAQGLITQGA